MGSGRSALKMGGLGWREARSGVIQGLVLALILFSIFSNDLEAH